MESINLPAETRTQNDKPNLRRYWYFWLPVTLFLVVMVRYPIRIHVSQSIYSAAVYGAIAVGCLFAAVRIYHRWGRSGQRLIAIILLCSMLSGWQVVDLLILRADWTWVSGRFCPLDGSEEYCRPYYGSGWYDHRFVDHHIRTCDTLGLVETFFGNEDIAISVNIDRYRTGGFHMDCGG